MAGVVYSAPDFGSKGPELTLKGPVTTAADDNFLFIYLFFSEKTSLDLSCKSSAWHTIHIKCQDLFSLKNKKINSNVVCY